MSIKKIQFTQEGYQKFEKDFQDLTVKREETVIRLQKARELGDLSENGAYRAAKFEVNSIDRQLRRLTYLLRTAEVVEYKNKGFVDFGCRVTVENKGKRLIFTLVNSFESDPKQNKLSIDSPIGKAVLGKKVREKIVITTPTGQVTYTIVSLN